MKACSSWTQQPRKSLQGRSESVQAVGSWESCWTPGSRRGGAQGDVVTSHRVTLPLEKRERSQQAPSHQYPLQCVCLEVLQSLCVCGASVHVWCIQSNIPNPNGAPYGPNRVRFGFGFGFFHCAALQLRLSNETRKPDQILTD